MAATPALRLALANARAAEALIVDHARNCCDLAYLRGIAAKLSAAMDALQREINAAPPVAGREVLEGMLVLNDIEHAPSEQVNLTFSEWLRRTAA